SIPVRPTAGTPRAISVATTRPFVRPPRTASARSRVSGSVTRSPRTNLVSMPSRSAHSPTAGPPPCTTTREWPPSQSDTTASRAASVSAPTEPPIFSTRTSLRGVFGIDPHVFRGEVGAHGARGVRSDAEVDLDRDLLLLEDPSHRGGIERARGAAREHPERVVRARVAVDADQVEARVGRVAGDRAQIVDGDVRVAQHEREEGRHVRMDHSGTLGDPAQPYDAGAQGQIDVPQLGTRVRRHDRPRDVLESCRPELHRPDRARDPVDREGHPDDPGSRHRDVVGRAADRVRGGLLHADSIARTPNTTRRDVDSSTIACTRHQLLARVAFVAGYVPTTRTNGSSEYSRAYVSATSFAVFPERSGA